MEPTATLDPPESDLTLDLLRDHVDSAEETADGIRAFTWRGGSRAQRSPLPVATLRRLALAAGIPPSGSGEVGEWEDADAARVIMVPFTDSSIDSYRTIVDPDGMDLARFSTNPVAFFSHESRQIPIGIWLRVDNAMLRGEDGVMRRGKVGHLLFSREELEPMAEPVYRNWIAGRLRGSSIGFLVKRGGWRLAIEEDRKLFKIPKDDDLSGLWILAETSLTEVSIVPVPANSSVTSRAAEVRHLAHSGAMTRADVAQLLGDEAVAGTSAEDWADVRAPIGPDVLLTGEDEPDNMSARLAQLERRVDALAEGEATGSQRSQPGADPAPTRAGDVQRSVLGIGLKANAIALAAKTRQRR